MGLQFLRFDDMDVKMNISGVIRILEDFIDDWEKKNL
jgi:hypothetical protein